MESKGTHTRENLLKVSAQLFREKGYQVTTMRDIASRLNMKKGSLYYHIKSKDALLQELVETTMGLLLDSARAFDISGPSKDKLRNFIICHIELICNNSDLFTVSLRELNQTNARSFWPEIVKKRREYEEILLNIIEDGQKNGAFKNLDKKIVAYGLLGMSNWMIRWYSLGKGKTPAETAEVWVEMILNGLTTDK